MSIRIIRTIPYDGTLERLLGQLPAADPEDPWRDLQWVVCVTSRAARRQELLALRQGRARLGRFAFTLDALLRHLLARLPEAPFLANKVQPWRCLRLALDRLPVAAETKRTYGSPEALRAAARLFGLLRGETDDEAGIIAGLRAPGDALAALLAAWYAAYREILREEGVLDRAAALREAARLLANQRLAGAELPQRLIVYGFYDLPEAERRFLAAVLQEVGRVGEAVVIIEEVPPGGRRERLEDLLSLLPAAVEGQAEPDEAGVTLAARRRLVQAAGAEEENFAGADDLGTVGARLRFCRYADREAEVRGIARQVRALLESGEALPNEIGVVFPALEVYAPLVRRVFTEEGVSYDLSKLPSMAEHPLARLLVSLVQLPLAHFRAEEVLAVVSSPYLALGPETAAGVRLLTELRGWIAEAGIIGGHPDLQGAWFSPLERLRQRRAAALAEREKPPEKEEYDEGSAAGFPASGTHRGAAELVRLEAAQQLLQALFYEVFSPLEASSPGRLRSWAERLITRLEVERRALVAAGSDLALRREARAVLAEFAQALRRAEAFFAGLGGGKLEPAEFFRLAAALLEETPLPGAGDTGERVQVIGFLETRARSFKHLFFGGMVEGEIPLPQDTGPLGTANPRYRAMLAGLPTSAEESRRIMLANLTNARAGMQFICPARAEEIALSPAGWAQRFARLVGAEWEETGGEEAPADRDAPCPRRAWQREVGRAVSTATADELPLLRREDALARALACPERAAEALQIVHAHAAERERDYPGFLSAYHGYLGQGPEADALSWYLRLKGRVSPSFLQRLAQNPADVFFGDLLGLVPPPPLHRGLDPAESGLLLHEALRDFYREYRDALAEKESADEERRERLAGVVRRHVARLGGSGGDHFFWRKLREFTSGILPLWEEEEDERPEEGEPLPRLDGPPGGRLLLWYEGFERGHLACDAAPVLLEHSLEVPLGALAPAGESLPPELAPLAGVKLACRLDRVDEWRRPRRPEMLVLDYKTGKADSLASILGGFSFPLPLYLLAARTGLAGGSALAGGGFLVIGSRGARVLTSVLYGCRPEDIFGEGASGGGRATACKGETCLVLPRASDIPEEAARELAEEFGVPCRLLDGPAVFESGLWRNLVRLLRAFISGGLVFANTSQFETFHHLSPFSRLWRLTERAAERQRQALLRSGAEAVYLPRPIDVALPRQVWERLSRPEESP